MKSELLYSILSILTSTAFFIHHKFWLQAKKKADALDNFDKFRDIPRNWLLIIFFAILGITLFFKYISK